MPQTEEWTIGRLLTWTTDFLKKSGSESARLDAEVLLAEARQCERIALYTAFNEVASERERTAFKELVRRRAEGAPVAYLVGHKEFFSLSFRVSEDVLIPRPETEFIVVALLDEFKKSGSAESRVAIADIGTGSGVLAVCAARHVPNSQVTAIDISPGALEIARSNVQKHGVEDRVQLLEGDLLSCCPAEPTFDFVLSNPPYVSEPEYRELEAGVRDFEPRIALVGGATGCELIFQLVDQAAERLKSGGCLIIEISPMIESEVVAYLNDSGNFHDVDVTKDLAGFARVVLAQLN